MKRLIPLFIALLCAMPIFAQQKESKTIALDADPTPQSMHDKLYQKTVLVKNGQDCVDFTVDKYVGEAVKLSQYKGKVVHICFWGTWCNPCLKELKSDMLPAVIKPYLDNEEFVFLPIAMDSREALDKFFASEKGKEYMWLKDYTCFDGERKTFALYATLGVPRSVIIGRDGKVVETSIGATEYELGLIDATLVKLLKK